MNSSPALMMQTPAEVMHQPVAPQSLGPADWILIALLVWGVLRGFQHGFTSELWSLAGGLIVLGVALFGYSPSAKLLSPFLNGLMPAAYIEWVGFLFLSFLTLLIYELLRLKLMGRLKLFVASAAESYVGAILGFFRMALFASWAMLVIFLMPDFYLLHYYCGQKSKSGWWLLQQLPSIEATVTPNYSRAQARIEELRREFSPKEFDAEKGKRTPAPRK